MLAARLFISGCGLCAVRHTGLSTAELEITKRVDEGSKLLQAADPGDWQRWRTLAQRMPETFVKQHLASIGAATRCCVMFQAALDPRFTLVCFKHLGHAGVIVTQTYL